jgi:hypothetical protein
MFSDATCAFRMVLHRITSCSAVADLVNWYHDVAVRIAPTASLAATIIAARTTEQLWAAQENASWEAQCLPFLRHVLSPSSACPPSGGAAQRRMLDATRLFLTAVPCEFAGLPAAASFGDVPVFDFWPAGADLSSLTPGVVDASFWNEVERHLPPVPRVVPGLEAEAPWVRPPRRVSRRGGHGMMPA